MLPKEIKNFEYSSPEEQRQKLLEPSFLPTMVQIVSAFSDPKKNESQADPIDQNWVDLARSGFYDLLNVEYIDTLANYLLSRATELRVIPQKPTTVLEIGAGNGRLAHFLRQRLNPDLITYIATDSREVKEERLKFLIPDESTEVMSYQEALQTYDPHIVICEWMPYHKDWTAAIRANRTVKEYILIGETGSGCCGEPWETWGNTYFNEALIDETPQYVKDGFRRVDLEGYGWTHLCHSDFSPNDPIHSRTVSFRKD